ncbi:helix-turn-helix domain-containing protein [Nonomuraea endophytica]|uniref:Transcriptional regulator with XRE-family HTH domain n=1 Tax=Nonomuraea endophytica TaxID=714136 RepID=A0A7W8A8C0_9ACTN|nr:helix-turn-helix transcriptional regulator [Nonomuraea endophytica]MBB5081405.1 transcriptional regulator with XRE-family HTH domain [Nonomuraea endophytica]
MAGAQLPHQPSAAPLWLWTSPEAQAALSRGHLGEILRAYRKATRTSQADLAEELQYDRTYIVRLENGQRALTDVDALRRLAEHLGLPAHALGVTDQADADFAAMIKFGESTVRLSALAREAGHSAEAINELWPLVWRLENRLMAGHSDRYVAHLLTQARVVLGVALGDILPEESLAAAARWTGRALNIAGVLDDAVLLTRALRAHGNELRKVKRKTAAAVRLQQAADVAPATERGTVLIPLARTLAELGDTAGFDAAVRDLHRFMDSAQETPLVNPFVVREVHLRGLLATGRVRQAVRLAEADAPDVGGVAPQWRAIEQVTVAEAFSLVADDSATTAALRQSILTAEALRLPHQIQRALRTARRRFPEIEALGITALQRLQLTSAG